MLRSTFAAAARASSAADSNSPTRARRSSASSSSTERLLPRGPSLSCSVYVGASSEEPSLPFVVVAIAVLHHTPERPDYRRLTGVCRNCYRTSGYGANDGEADPVRARGQSVPGAV